METIREIARSIETAGGRAYFVGGYVRDRLLGVDNKDVDIEVHGITAEDLYSLLLDFGNVKMIGRNFGIYTLSCKGSSDENYQHIDIALPRQEKNTGRGHRNFEIYTDPFLGTKAAARRRDFTINAIMEDVLTGEIIDHFGGLDDLEAGILKHVNDLSFPEDPLRVLRAAQFAARFGFDIAAQTVSLCKGIDLSELPAERIETELEKGLCKGRQPSRFFSVLKEMQQLDFWFPEVKFLIGLQQDPVYHPEGDVWTHTMKVLDNAASEKFEMLPVINDIMRSRAGHPLKCLRDSSSDPFGFMLLALTHDFGKIDASRKINGRIHAYEHEKTGLPAVRRFLDRVTGNRELKHYVINMVALHMKPNMTACGNAKIKSTNRMFDQALSPEDLIAFSAIDKSSEGFEGEGISNIKFLFRRLEIYEEYMSRPYVNGQDLIEAGLEPGEQFKDALSFAHKLRLAGTDKESALKQTLGYIKKKA